MERQFVQSSNLYSVGWEDGTLEVEFRDGAIYQYFDVPMNEYVALMNASSHGKYFCANIKNNYRFTKK